VDYGKLRRSQFVRNTQRKVSGPTVIQELSYVRGVLKHALSEWDDCENLAPVMPALEAAILVLSKRGLVNKSVPRTQIPEGDQLERLKAAARERAKEPRCTIKRLDDVIEFAEWSTRRLGEICRITHGDADYERGMYCVRDVKHPTKKKGNDKWFPMLGPIKDILQRQPRLTGDPNERFFPYNAKSVSQAYAALKRELGIKNLRFHDNRRLAITQWLAVFGNPHKVKLISGHETTQILERVYDATKGDGLLAEYAEIMKQRPEQRA
jgi:integrase